MSLLALILALLFDRLSPLPEQGRLRAGLDAWLRLLISSGAALGGHAWWLLALASGLLAWAAHVALGSLHPLLALIFDVVVLYALMGFSRDAARFSEIHAALLAGKRARAAELLAAWCGSAEVLDDEGEVSRLAMERALVAAHRNVFGVSFWFVFLPGLSGAVAYGLVRFLASGLPDPQGLAARRLLDRLDWIPARVTAIGFSIVGNFEDALYCWRSQARQWHNEIEGILVSSGAGAMGVKLGSPLHCGGRTIDRPELGAGAEAGPELLQGAVELVWRTLVLCLALLTLFSISGWVGG